MSLSKLKRLHVIIIGAVACVAAGVGLYFLLISPVEAQIGQVSKELAASQQVADRMPSAQRGLETALNNVARVQTQLARYEAGKMPNLSFAERDKGMIQLWREQSETLGPILQKWASKGVSLRSPINLPAPPTNPNQLETNLITIPVGKIEVVGDFKSLMSHIRGWNSCPRLVQIDKPSLSGTSPFLKATYDATVYIFPKGQAGPEIQMAGGSAAGAAQGPITAPTPTPAPPSGGGGGGGEGGMGRRGMEGA